MAEQDLQYGTNNAPTHSSDMHTDKWRDKQKRQICTDVHTHTELLIVMIDETEEFLWGITYQTSRRHTV